LSLSVVTSSASSSAFSISTINHYRSADRPHVWLFITTFYYNQINPSGAASVSNLLSTPLEPAPFVQ
jgi:hypothetical protein